MPLNIIQTEIPGVIIFEPKIFGDQRGYFLETFRTSWLKDSGINTSFVQDNISRSKRGSLRGLHFQLINPQAKLVMVTKGEVLDVAVDVRINSTTFGKHVTCHLSEENRRVMYIPEGFAHGFQVISEMADFMYKCSNYYDPNSERGISALDSDLNIQWHALDHIMSERDQKLPLLANMSIEDLPTYKF